MKPELELKHIAPYLPYNLKLYTIDGVISSYTLSTDGEVVHRRKGWLVYEYHVSDVKPILRPLGNLLKNTDKEHLFKLLKMQYRNIKDVNKCSTKNDGVYYGQTHLTYLNYGTPQGISCLPYCAVQYLFEHHFDVFGLINKGLAIEKTR